LAVSSPAIEESLARAEDALDRGEGLAGTGFWAAVAQVKRQPELVDRYARRIDAIDLRAHREWPWLVIPLGPGTILAVGVVLAGLALIWMAYELTGTAAVIVFLAGLVALLGSTHGLGHLVVGRLLGIRFHYWYVAAITRPQPGVKLDYDTYLRADPVRRAWMHAAGAIITKVIPFALIGAAVAANLPLWLPWALGVLGVAMVVIDVVWSAKSSDWKKFKRELAYTRP
jgi:hypothetical protein